MRPKIHGDSDTRLYRIWKGIKGRCFNMNSNIYKYYGGRGIKICNEWLAFLPFRDWSLNNGYADNLEIDRKDTNGNYNSENCHFITHEKNCQNRSTTKLTLEKDNEIRYLYNTGNYYKIELAEKYNINIDTIYDVINNKIWIEKKLIN